MRLLIGTGIVILGFVSFALPRAASFTVPPHARALSEPPIASGGLWQASLWLAGAGMLAGFGFAVASARKRARLAA